MTEKDYLFTPGAVNMSEKAQHHILQMGIGADRLEVLMKSHALGQHGDVNFIMDVANDYCITNRRGLVTSIYFLETEERIKISTLIEEEKTWVGMADEELPYEAS